ncbi:uncharacterized protein LOC111913513 [Lactuca sativa]|uniref:uncharacterized protein LOC111913513 n=1 Tax=Lactuca sativa TaxID=4236 RepID=UPI000CAF3465|nr:uncharacterized protein LOC111913513 [Lactuca sativa]
MDDNATTSYSTGVHTPLLNNFVDGAVDYRGRPAVSSKSGLWRSAYFVIGNVNHSPPEIKIVVKRILGVVHGNGGRERERMDWDGIASYPRLAILLLMLFSVDS